MYAGAYGVPQIVGETIDYMTTVKYLLCNFRWEAKSEEFITGHGCRSCDSRWG